MTRLLAGLAAVLLPVLALAQARGFPDHPLRIIVHVAPGSGSDTMTRFVAERLSKVLGQPVVVENRPSANGVVAVMAAKAAPADGYTILLTSISTLSVNPVVVKNLPYDPIRDFKPLSGLVRMTSAIVAPDDSPYRGVQDLVAASRKGDAPLTFGSYSAGYRLTMEWLGELAGLKLTNVPYKGASGMIPDVVGGRIDVAIVDAGGVESLAKTGKLRVLAVTGEKRVREFPDVPTVAEAGYSEFVNYPWTALHVRTETPDDITAKLADAMQKVLAMEEVREYAAKTPGTDLLPLRPAEMREYYGAELARFRRLADKLGIKPE
jgi:tripartite-type tricarboxylate transporter receptor subunit TctC